MCSCHMNFDAVKNDDLKASAFARRPQVYRRTCSLALLFSGVANSVMGGGDGAIFILFNIHKKLVVQNKNI